MPRDMRAHENQRRAKARREGALARAELREQSTPRSSAEGPTSFAVKARSPDVERLIESFLTTRQGVDNG